MRAADRCSHPIPPVKEDEAAVGTNASLADDDFPMPDAPDDGNAVFEFGPREDGLADSESEDDSVGALHQSLRKFRSQS